MEIPRQPSFHDRHLHNEVDLYFHLTNCPKLDTFSQSDPFVVVYMKLKGEWVRIGNTEIVWDNHNPKWVKAIRTDFFFEQVQTLRFDVYDADHKDTRTLAGHDLVGSCTCNLGNLVHAVQKRKKFTLMKNGREVIVKRRPTQLLCRVEEVNDNQDELQMKISGVNLAAMDWGGTSDPFVEFCKPTEDGGWLPVARTEVLKRTTNPRFKNKTLKLATLCNGDINMPLKVRCLDWNMNSDPDLIGEAEISVRDILNGSKAEVHLSNRNGPRSCCGMFERTNWGTLRFQDARITKGYSFLQYLQAGLEVQLVVAIDFTGSNGDPHHPGSLHAFNKPGGNDYQRAIHQVMEVLEPYDSDGKIPVFGFGCKKKGYGQVTSHCMALSFDPSNPEVEGTEGVMQVYDQALRSVTLSGPTLFQEILDTATSISDQPISRSEQTYTVLLIITDGVINDMEKSINRIVRAGSYPLSIIIVGVGNADFDNMEILDADEVPLRHTDGTVMPRDIVQFVPFNEFKHSPGMLAKETLREIPDQVTDFMKMRTMPPMPENSRMSVRSLPGMEKDYLNHGAASPPPAGGGGGFLDHGTDEKDAALAYDSFPAKHMDNNVYGAIDHSAQFRASAPRLSPRGRGVEVGGDSLFKKPPRKPSVNQNFVCPITQDIMKDPVMAADGFTYEREAISEWFKDHKTSPQTNLELEHTNLIPNHAIRSMIMESQTRRAAGGGSSVGV